jgi:ornithine cyclodeaminase/alanine dehydrogenase-like protein (mu-crystallin family)
MAQLLVLSEQDVLEMLTMRECIAVMEDALAGLARGEADQPLRSLIRPDKAPGFLGLMPSYRRGEKSYFGLKEVCVFPGNPARGLDTHLGGVLLHSGETGELLAIVNASTITAIRTAAVSAVATKLLAREDAHVLTIIGTGVQGESHRESIPLVREIKDLRMIGKGENAESAVRDADIIVTATNSKEPVLRREWLKPGVHINAVGSSIASARELDGATVAAASLFVDRRESTVNESGDYLFALREGAIRGEQHIRAEIGEILAGKAKGRTKPDEITLFKSLGLAIEDLASAAFLYEKAAATKAGTWVAF